jgi:hypothetical protein
MRTVLSTIRAANCWRVQIAWPNGVKKHYGRFLLESDAAQWLAQHQWLTEQEIIATRPLKRAKDFGQADKFAVDVATSGQTQDCLSEPEVRKKKPALGRKAGAGEGL